MRKWPQIFTRIDVQNVPVSDHILDDLEQEELAESAVREIVRGIIRESFRDIVKLEVRMRVKVRDLSDPTLQDILTNIRGIRNVITVRQDGKLSRPTQGRQMVNLVIGFEDDKHMSVDKLKKRIWIQPGVDMVFIKSYDGREWNE